MHEERAGTRRIYHADRAALGELRAYINDMWRTVLESFVDAVEEEKKER